MKAYKTLIFLIVIALLLIQISSLSVPTNELVNFPDDYPYKGNTYSGFTPLRTPGKKLHYLFLESQNNPSKDPIIIWLSGGPGCSSLMAWCKQNGPAIIQDGSSNFEVNPYSLNKNANVLYLEAPAGTGFSVYNYDWDIETNDSKNTDDLYTGIVMFFEKFGKYKINDVYLAGEGYAGIYIPLLADKIKYMNDTGPSVYIIFLKGILIENGFTNYKNDGEEALYDFAYYHNLYSPELRQIYVTECTVTINEKNCFEIKETIKTFLSNLNVFDFYRKCYNASNKSNYLSEAKVNYFMKDYFTNTTIDWGNDYHCLDTKPATDFLNRVDVQKALYVEPREWSMCSELVRSKYSISKNDESIYTAYNNLITKYRLKILIYSGDTDLTVPTSGTINWIKSLNLEIIEEDRPWSVKSNGVQIAGFITKYKGLTFATIMGCGHYPWKKEENYYLLKNFINNIDI